MNTDPEARLISRLRARKLPKRRLITSEAENRINLVLLAITGLICLGISITLFWDTPFSLEGQGSEWLLKPVIMLVSAAALLVISNLAVAAVRYFFMGLEGGIVIWFQEMILGLGGFAIPPGLEQMYLLKARGEKFPAITEITGIWVSQREDGLLDGTDLRHLCQAAWKLQKIQNKREARAKKIRRKQLAPEALTRQREQIAKDMKESGLETQIEAYRQNHVMEQATAAANGATKVARL